MLFIIGRYNIIVIIITPFNIIFKLLILSMVKVYDPCNYCTRK